MPPGRPIIIQILSGESFRCVKTILDNLINDSKYLLTYKQRYFNISLLFHSLKLSFFEGHHMVYLNTTSTGSLY